MRRGDLQQLVAGREVDQALDEVEAHAAHAGVVQSPAARASVTLRRTVATPRALPPLARSASTIARLSAPWQVACTMTLRAKPRWSRSANSCSLQASQGVYLRSGAYGNSAPGPNTWQCASTAPGGSLNARLRRAGVPVEPAGGLLELHRCAHSVPSFVGLDRRRGCGRPRCASRRCARIACRALRTEQSVVGEVGDPGLAFGGARRRPRRQADLAHGLGDLAHLLAAAAAMLDHALEEIGALLLPVDAGKGFAAATRAPRPRRHRRARW